MKLLPEKNWLRLICLVISTVLLTFVATSCLAVRAPIVPLNIDHYGRAAYLELTKKLIFKKDMSGCVVYIYSERINFRGKTIELVNTEQLETVIKQAINDFPTFVLKRHGLIIPKKRIKYLVMILASEEYFSSYEISNKRGSVGAITKDGKLSKRMYFKVYSSQFDITTHKSIIRHEIFHWIAFEYGIDGFLPHDNPHGDAYDFSNLK